MMPGLSTYSSIISVHDGDKPHGQQDRILGMTLTNYKNAPAN